LGLTREPPPDDPQSRTSSLSDRDVSFSADYPIGDDVELVSVRLRNLTCTCADPPQQAAQD
jgi:hypothetical protein